MDNLTAKVNSSSAAHFSSVDYSILGTLLAISIAIGLYFGISSKKDHSGENYLQNSRNMGPLMIALSLVAGLVAPSTITSTPSEIYEFGWLFFLLLPTMVLVASVTIFLFLPVFHENAIDNIYAYLEMRFSKTVRRIVSVAFVVNGLLFIPIILYIPSLTLSEVTGHNVHVVNTLVCYCCVFYTLLGGIKAVVWTDVVQAFVIVASLIIVVSYGTKSAGGVREALTRAVTGKRIYSPDLTFELMKRHSFWNMFLGNFVLWTWNVCFDQKYMPRIVALPTLAEARRSLVYFTVGFILIYFLTMFTGIIMYAYYQECDPVKAKIVTSSDKMVSRFVQDTIGDMTGMTGVFISSIFSASLSTISITLNTQAGIIYTDFIRPLNLIRHTERNSDYSMKLLILLIGTFSIVGGIAIEKLGSLFQVVYTLAGICGGPIVGVFTMGMLHPWANRHGALCGLLIGMIGICCIIINTQVAIGNGQLKYETLPTSVDKCAGESVVPTNQASLENETIIPDEEFAFYKIAFMWYGPLGLLMTWTSGIIISFLTGGHDLNQSNLNLLSPCIIRLLPQKYRHIQLQAVPEVELTTPASQSSKTQRIYETILDSAVE